MKTTSARPDSNGVPSSYKNRSAIICSSYSKILSDRQKMAVLTQTFPGLKVPDIQGAFNKCRGHLEHAINTLLDQIFSANTNRGDEKVKPVIESEPKSTLHNNTEKKVHFSIPVAFPAGVPRGTKDLVSINRMLRSRGGVRLSPQRRLQRQLERGVIIPAKSTGESHVQHSKAPFKNGVVYRSKISNIPTAAHVQDGGKAKRKSAAKRLRKKGKDGGKDTKAPQLA